MKRTKKFIRDTIGELKKKYPQTGDPDPLRRTVIPEIKHTSGRITVWLHQSKHKNTQRHMDALLSFRTKVELIRYLKTAKIWDAGLSSNLAEERGTPGRAYCGFIAMDRIINGMDRTIDVRETDGVENILSVIKSLIGRSKDPLRSNWRNIIPALRSKREHLSSTHELILRNKNDWIAPPL